MRQSAPRQPPNEDSEISSASKTRAPTINLPKGGGAVRGIGEKFAANPVTGTSSMSGPIATSPGRGGMEPQLSLNYDSGVWQRCLWLRLDPLFAGDRSQSWQGGP